MDKLLIKKSSDPQRWYSKLVGKTLPFLGNAGNGEYKSREPSGYVNFVRQGDAEIIRD